MSSCDGLNEPVAKVVDLLVAVGDDSFVLVHPRLLGGRSSMVNPTAGLSR
jgi:hypothetical protein